MKDLPTFSFYIILQRFLQKDFMYWLENLLFNTN